MSVGLADSRLGAPLWRLFGASAASNLADGVARAVVPLLAVTLTRDPRLIAAATGLAFLPWLLFALPAGTLVDRGDRRRVMFAVVNGVTSALQSLPNAVLVLYVLDVLHLPAASYGLVLVGTGVGGLVGGLVAPVLSRRLGRVRTLSLTSVLFPLPLLAMSLTHDAVIGCALGGGVLASATNVPAVFAAGGVGCLLAGLWMTGLLHRHGTDLAA